MILRKPKLSIPMLFLLLSVSCRSVTKNKERSDISGEISYRNEGTVSISLNNDRLFARIFLVKSPDSTLKIDFFSEFAGEFLKIKKRADSIFVSTEGQILRYASDARIDSSAFILKLPLTFSELIRIVGGFVYLPKDSLKGLWSGNRNVYYERVVAGNKKERGLKLFGENKKWEVTLSAFKYGIFRKVVIRDRDNNYLGIKYGKPEIK